MWSFFPCTTFFFYSSILPNGGAYLTRFQDLAGPHLPDASQACHVERGPCSAFPSLPIAFRPRTTLALTIPAFFPLAKTCIYLFN